MGRYIVGVGDFEIKVTNWQKWRGYSKIWPQRGLRGTCCKYSALKLAERGSHVENSSFVFCIFSCSAIKYLLSAMINGIEINCNQQELGLLKMYFNKILVPLTYQMISP